MTRTIISIKVDTNEGEEKILAFLKIFCDENFQAKAEICVTGKEKTLYHNKDKE